MTKKKSNMRKRVASLVMAVVMCLGLGVFAVPVMAAEIFPIPEHLHNRVPFDIELLENFSVVYAGDGFVIERAPVRAINHRPTPQEIHETDSMWFAHFFRAPDLLVMVNRENNMRGVVDLDGNIVVPFEYNSIASVIEGRALVNIGGMATQEGRFGFLDENGELVIPVIYNNAFDFSDGLARVIVNVMDETIGWELPHTRYIDRNGNIVIDRGVVSVSADFSEGFAHVAEVAFTDGVHPGVGLMDRSGNIIPYVIDTPGVRVNFSWHTQVRDGLVRLLDIDNTKYGFVDTSGRIVIDFVHEGASDFSGGFARVFNNDVLSFIDVNGNEVLSFPANMDWDFGVDSLEREGRAPRRNLFSTFADDFIIATGIDFLAENVTMYVFRLTHTVPSSQPTPDLSTASAWAVDFITRAIDLNLVPQNLQGAYTQPTTRAEFAAFAVALYEVATGRTITGRMQFNDTTDPNVQMMGYLGVVTGVGNDNFNPNGELTREQAAVMIARLANVIGQPLSPSAPTFADNADISSWAVDAVGQMQATGIMGGVGDNRFAPSGDYTREQSIITILRLFDILN